MLRISKLLAAFSISAFLYVGSAVVAQADTITLPAADSGQYTDTGSHSPTNQNYLVGRGSAGTVFRNFFVFNLSGVSGTITGATLQLFNPAGAYISSDPSNTYTTFDVLTPIAQLTAGGTGRTDIFADLGSGVSYGSVTVTSASNNSIITFSLNAVGIAALNNARGSFFALGGAITTLGTQSPDGLFAFTGSANLRQLVITTDASAPIPEPTTMILLGTGLAGVAARVRRRRRTD